MESIFKSFLGIFFLLMLSCTGIGLVEASIDARGADSFLSSAVSQIEAAHYSRNVISDCQTDALSRGYRLEVDLSENDVGEYCGVAQLTYVYHVPLLGLSQTHVARENIR